MRTMLADRPKSRSGLKTLAGLLPFLAPYRRRLIVAGIALLIAAGATLAMPYGFRQLIDLGFSSAGTVQTTSVNLTFIALFGIACVLAVATAARFYMVSWLGERVTSVHETLNVPRVVARSTRLMLPWRMPRVK